MRSLLWSCIAVTCRWSRSSALICSAAPQVRRAAEPSRCGTHLQPALLEVFRTLPAGVRQGSHLFWYSGGWTATWIDYNFRMRYFLGFLIVAWTGFTGTLHAQDFTVFGGFQHPGTLTLSSGVGGVGGAIGVPSINSPDDLSGFQIDPKDFGIFGVRLYRSAAPLDWSTPSRTVRISLTATAMPFSSVRICGWNCPHPDSGLTRQPVGVSFVREAAGLPASGRSSVLTMGAGCIWR